MLIYILVYIFSLFFTYLASQRNNWLYHFVAIVAPILLLTFRDVSVGTDTVHYEDIFNYSSSAASLSIFILSFRLEIGFASITYLISNMGLDVSFAFFIYASLTVIPIYVGALCLKKKTSPVIIMALYYLMFYQYSFNIVRQSIAMSFVFLSAVLLVNNKTKLSIIVWIFALLNHNTAIIFIVFFMIFKMREENILKKMIIICVVFLVLIGILTLNFSDQINYYNDAYLSKGQGSSQMSYLIEMLLNFCIVIYARIKQMEDSDFYLHVSLMTLCLIVASPLAPFVFRIANLCDIIMLIYIPLTITSVLKPIHKFYYFSFAIFYWWFVFILNNSGGSFPYIFDSFY